MTTREISPEDRAEMDATVTSTLAALTALDESVKRPRSKHASAAALRAVAHYLMVVAYEHALGTSLDPAELALQAIQHASRTSRRMAEKVRAELIAERARKEAAGG